MGVGPWVAASAALGALVAGCVTVPACPGKGGPPWRELASAHFRLRTDLDPDDAAEAVRSLEATRAAMLLALWPGAPDPPQRTEVIALRSHLELMAFTAKESTQGLHVRRAPFLPVIVTGGDLRGSDRQILVHELAHDLGAWFLPTCPRWYAEGIATFIETLRYDRDGQKAIVGEPSQVRLADLRRAGILRAEKLLASTDQPEVSMARLEGAAWLLVHYLVDKHPREFAALQRRLGALERSERAWAATFPDLPPERLDAELWRYMSNGVFLGGQLALVVPPTPVDERVMSDAEVHAARAYLYKMTNLSREPRDAATRSEITEANAADPTNVEALALEFYALAAREDAAYRAELARRATVAHPDDWLAWLMTADATGDQAAQRVALTRALARAPSSPGVLERLAILDAQQGRWEEGVGLSLKAMRLGVRDPALVNVHIANLAHTGRCADAALLSTLVAAGSPPAEARAIATRWSALEAVCASRSAPAAGDGTGQPAP